MFSMNWIFTKAHFQWIVCITYSSLPHFHSFKNYYLRLWNKTPLTEFWGFSRYYFFKVQSFISLKIAMLEIRSGATFQSLWSDPFTPIHVIYSSWWLGKLTGYYTWYFLLLTCEAASILWTRVFITHKNPFIFKTLSQRSRCQIRTVTELF